MYLKKLELTNFRSFEHSTIELRKGVTLFVGENNAGKSNAIDAIRLLTTPLSRRRDIYCEPMDVRHKSGSSEFKISATYSDLSPLQQGHLISVATSHTLDEVRFGLTYDKNSYPTPPAIWGGSQEVTPEPGCHSTIRHVYLPPLRDARQALGSGNPQRVNALLRHFLGEQYNDRDLPAQFGRNKTHPLLGDIDTAVQKELTSLTDSVRQQQAAIGFAANETMLDIARDLRFRLADEGVDLQDLRHSGHGYANLLYLATIAVELDKVSDADLTLFLVEEPEAHLHPQLQAAVLGFLQDRCNPTKKESTAVASPDGAKSKAPVGDIQVVVATHSPNLTAWTDHRSLVYFRSIKNKPQQTDKHSADGTSSTTVPVSKAYPLAQIGGLDDEARRKIDRYLDVTKSAMLFGGRVLLVEGIAEALLLPLFAEYFVLKDDPEKLRRFRSVVFLPIGGTDFEPYVRLLATPSGEGITIADRVVVMTDGDATTDSDDDTPRGQAQKDKLDALAKEIGASALLHVEVSTYSLETELLEAGNTDLMRAVFVGMHRNSGARWDTEAAKSGAERALGIHQLFKTRSKGEYAHRLAEEVIRETRTKRAPGSPVFRFHVPAYITKAIQEVVADVG
jgi:putative ATP-dependent endonuclease of OLD family